LTKRAHRISLAALLVLPLLAAIAAVPFAAQPANAATTLTLKARCGVNLRATPSVTARIRTTVASGTQARSSGTVSGSRWHAVCNGRSISGSTWYRITSFGGRSVTSRYGVAAVYAAKGMFSVTSTTTTTSTTVPSFGSRPSSGPIRLSGSACQGVTISNRTFRNLGSKVVAISLSGCKGVVIDGVDFDAVAEGVFAINSSGITVRNTRYRNITGPSARDGGHHGNLVQFDTVNSFAIHHNRGVGGDTEDIVSLFRSGNGRVTDNHFEGTTWSSRSGTGIIVGDGGSGSNVEVARNVLVSPGQVGIQVIGGTGHRIHDNVLYAAPRSGLTSPNVAISSYASNPTAEVWNNRVYWRKNDGSQNPYWWGSGHIDAHDNTWRDSSLTLSPLRVHL
jgi:hypothetical protein